MKTVKRVLLSLAVLLGIAAAALAYVYTVRPGLDQEAAHRLESPPRPGALTATWFGVSGVLLTDGTSAIFVDPFLTRPAGFLNLVRNAPIAPDVPLIRDVLARAGVSRLDAVLVSHSHYDHAMDAGVVAQMTGARLAGSASTANIGRGAGLDDSMIDVIAPGHALQFGAFKVTFIEGKHAGASGGRPTGDIEAPLQVPATYLDYRQGGTYSILIEHPQGTILHHGSAGYVPGALAGRRADIVFLGIALLPDLGDYLANVVDAVGAKRIVPVHWDDFTRPLSQPFKPFPLAVRLDKFFDAMQKRPALAVQTLAPMQPVALFPPN